MLLLHAHWRPPAWPADSGNMLLWAETSSAPAPVLRRGKPAARPKAKPHPFAAAAAELQALPALTAVRAAPEGRCTLQLPSTRTGPLPAPGLWHEWELDTATPPFLAPWEITGLALPPPAAVELLARLPAAADLSPGLRLGADVHFWHTASALVVEALAGQKLAPVLAQAGSGYHARWLPLFDGVQDAPRLARLVAAMPPVCRAATVDPAAPPAPRWLLDTFLHLAADALARHWGRHAAPRGPGKETDQRWLAALFRDDPTVRGSAAQLDALAHSHRAWMRNLTVAGDAAFRIAFRMEAPLQQVDTPGTTAWQLHFLLQARDDPSLLVPAAAIWQSKGRVLTQAGRRFEQPQEKLLAGLGYAGRLFPPITAGLKTARPEAVALDNDQAYAFLRQVAPLLEGAGFAMLVPPWWNKPGSRLGVRLRLRPGQGQSTEASAKSRLGFDNVVNFRWELTLGDVALTREEFATLAALKAPLVQMRGQWVQLDPEQVEAAIRFWQQQIEGEIGLEQAMRLGLGAEASAGGLSIDQVVSEGWVADWLAQLTGRETMSELEPPVQLQATLRPYQRFGYSWLSFLQRWGLGACLADDMGLGKTIQTIALLLHEKDARGALPGPTLLVCPTSVVTNWEREVKRFAPVLTTWVHQGGQRLRDDELLQATRSVDLVLTSYAVLRRDIVVLRQTSWFGLVLDEAQNIKNPEARQAQAVRSLPAAFRIALTGTPVENRLSELWSIMHFLNPGYLGSRQGFRREFGLPIERYGDEQATTRLKTLIQPFMLRRVKSDPSVIQDLPDKVETKAYCQLSEEQATLYQAVVEDAMRQVEESEGIQRKGLVLSMLMQLKQICNHPVHYLHQTGGKDVADLNGRSGKLERLLELLEEVVAAGDRALIFTQFAEMGALLHAYLPNALGAATLFLHGGVPPAKRDPLLARFEEEQGPPLFILSLKAGGSGLNLTRANHVFHFDRWWNPAVEDQATDRAFRIGQRRNVHVHKFVCVGTVEEKIDEMIESKKTLARAIVGSGENWLTELSTGDLYDLVRLRQT